MYVPTNKADDVIVNLLLLLVIFTIANTQPITACSRSRNVGLSKHLYLN